MLQSDKLLLHYLFAIRAYLIAFTHYEHRPHLQVNHSSIQRYNDFSLLFIFRRITVAEFDTVAPVFRRFLSIGVTDTHGTAIGTIFNRSRPFKTK